MSDKAGDEYTVKFACSTPSGSIHTEVVILHGPEGGRQAVLDFLRHTHCSTCQARQRLDAAYKLRDSVGLQPLRGDERQVELAEIIRAQIWRNHLPWVEHVEAQLTSLVELFNRRPDAVFWLEQRSLVWTIDSQSRTELVTALLEDQKDG